MKRCSQCLLPSTRPDTAFTEGVCSACISHESRKHIDWDDKKRQLVELLDKHDGKCIVPSSGGKDSFTQVITLLEMGADVTALTASTCHLTAIGRRNIDTLAGYVDTVEITPNRSVRAKLNRLGLEMVGDISWAEHISIHTVPFRFALQTKTPLIFFGENPLAHYGSPTSEHQKEQRMTKRWTAEFGGFLGLRPADLVGVEGISACDMAAYCGPTDQRLNEAGVEAYFLGQFVPWCSHANVKTAVEHGFEAVVPGDRNWWCGENEDNFQTCLHDYLMQKKYGYGRACAQMSVDIRSGRYTREELRRECDRMESLYPDHYLGKSIEDILEPIGLTRERFDEIVEEYTRCP